MNRLHIKIKAKNSNPYREKYKESDPFVIEVGNAFSADEILSSHQLIGRLKQYIKENYIRDVDVNSTPLLESQLNSLGEFCVSLKKDWFKQYFLVTIRY